MSEVLSVLAKLDGDAKGMVTAFDQADRSMRDMGDQADKTAKNADGSITKMEGSMSKTLKRLGGVLIATFSVGAIISFGRQAIDSASDLQEAATAVGAVFGEAYEGINKWAQGAATAMGMSTLSALDAAKTFGVYGSQAGLAADANANFSQTLVGTAADLASFHNADPSEVIAAIGSGLRGEAEPLRRFGILMNEASLNAAAMKAGISDGIEPLNAQQKILAANALILGSVGAAAGDFAETSGGLANQQRILAANWTNLTAVIGGAFLPIAEMAVSALNNMMPAISGGADALNATLGPAFTKLFDNIGPVVATLRETFGPILATLGPQVLDLVMALSPLGIVFKAIQPVLPLISDALSIIGTILSGVLTSALPIITDLVGTLAGALGDTLAVALPVVAELLARLGGIIQTLMPTIMEVAGVLIDNLLIAFDAIMPAILGLLPVINELLNALFPIIAPILDIVQAFLPLSAVVGTLVGAILPPLIQMLMAVLPPIISLVSPLLDMLIPALEFTAAVIGTVVDWISTAITWFLDMNSQAEALGGGVSGTFEQMGAVIGGVIDVIGAVIGWIAGLIKQHFNNIMATARVLGDVFRNIFEAIGGFISSAFTSAVSVVKGAINGIIGLVNGAIGFLNKLKVDIPDWVPLLGGMSFGVNLPKIPMLANGGDIVSPGLTWVGERGPELLNLPRGASVAPLGKLDSFLGGGGGTTTNHIEIKVDATGLNAADKEALLDDMIAKLRFALGGEDA